MKYKVPIEANAFVKLFENLDKISEVLGTPVDIYGIVINVKKGMFKSVEEKYTLSYSITRGSGKYIVVFRLSGSVEPVARVEIEDRGKGCEVKLECVDKNLCRYVNSLVKKLIDNIEIAIEKIRRNVDLSEHRLKFRLSSKYIRFIDGLAEVTLSSLYLRYPLLDRKLKPLNEISNLENFLTEVHTLYSSRVNEVFVHISAPSWMFVLAVDLSSREYTPSFIDLKTSTRLIGKEAVEALKQRNDPYVTVTILNSSTKYS